MGGDVVLLGSWERAKVAVAECASIDEAKDIRDKAQALLVYAKQAAESFEVQNNVAEIKVRAERKIGEFSRQLEKHERIRTDLTAPHDGEQKRTKTYILRSSGIDPKHAHRYETMAGIPEQDFENMIAETRRKCAEITSSGIFRFARALQKNHRINERYSCMHPEAIDDLVSARNAGLKFSTIYADPPWKYSNQATRASTDNHYRTMTVDDICALPIRDIADANAHLHLWTTNAFLFEAKRVMEAWGFEYKSVFVWVKPQMGIGNYWRVSHEFMLFGIRGKCPFLDRAQMSWLKSPRGRHSSKPDEIRTIIEKVSPGPRLELFARALYPGWFGWGNEIDNALMYQESDNAAR